MHRDDKKEPPHRLFFGIAPIAMHAYTHSAVTNRVLFFLSRVSVCQFAFKTLLHITILLSALALDEKTFPRCFYL